MVEAEQVRVELGQQVDRAAAALVGELIQVAPELPDHQDRDTLGVLVVTHLLAHPVAAVVVQVWQVVMLAMPGGM